MHSINEKTNKPEIVGNLFKWVQDSNSAGLIKQKENLAQKDSWFNQAKVSPSQKELLRLDSFGEGQRLNVYSQHFH